MKEPGLREAEQLAQDPTDSSVLKVGILRPGLQSWGCAIPYRSPAFYILSFGYFYLFIPHNSREEW